MTAPLPARPAATVMLLRDTPAGISVFLMRRHARMEFVAGATVFPGGGVDDRDRRPGPEWIGPQPEWFAARLGVSGELARALVCAAARETFEECGVLFASEAATAADGADTDGTIVTDASRYARQRAALAAGSVSFADFLRAERLVLRADLLRPWANWVTPEAERTRRYDTYFFVAALPDGQHADGENSETDQASWLTPQAALDEFAGGRSQLLPPTWTQLDALRGRTVAEVLAVQRRITPVLPRLIGNADSVDGNWEVEFFDADRYNAARRDAQRATSRGAGAR